MENAVRNLRQEFFKLSKREGVFIIVAVVLLALVSFGIWNKNRYEQCEKFLDKEGQELVGSLVKNELVDKEKVREKLEFCVALVYGLKVDLSGSRPPSSFVPDEEYTERVKQ